MDAICIANKHAEILFFSRFNHSLEKSIFDKFLCKITSSAGNPPPSMIIGEMLYVYISQDELYWCSCVQKSSFLATCGPLFVAENLSDFQKICTSLIGTSTQHSIIANMVLLQEIVMETMCRGYMQTQNVDKIRALILSNVVSGKESSIQSVSPGLFGIEKTAPTTASQQSLLSLEGKKKEVFVDVVEKVWATVGACGRLLRAEVSGSLVLHCLLLHSPTIILGLNSDLKTASDQEGFEPKVRLSEVEFGAGVDVSRLEERREIRAVAQPGETLLLRYALPPSLPHVLPFALVATHKQLTPSDVELKLKLSSTTGMGTVSPKVVVRVTAPASTSTIMSRTNGPRHQTISFAPSEKIITWVITDFPGGSYAQSFIRLVDAGEGATSDSGVVEFEVSKWVSSGLRVESVRLDPKTLKADKWVRYLTTSDTVTFKFT